MFKIGDVVRCMIEPSYNKVIRDILGDKIQIKFGTGRYVWVLAEFYELVPERRIEQRRKTNNEEAKTKRWNTKNGWSGRRSPGGVNIEGRKIPFSYPQIEYEYEYRWICKFTGGDYFISDAYYTEDRVNKLLAPSIQPIIETCRIVRK